jgi:hypothetical protein
MAAGDGSMSEKPALATDYKWWCESCGALTNDGECDCTMFDNTMRCQKLRRTIGLDWGSETEGQS